MNTPQQDQQVQQDQQFDFDRLHALAIAAAACLKEVRQARETGQPLPSTEPLEQFALFTSPALVLLVMYRLQRATELVDTARAALPDLRMRKPFDVFMTGVLTEADIRAAWPHHAPAADTDPAILQ